LLLIDQQAGLAFDVAARDSCTEDMHLELQILGKERIFKKTFSAFPLASAAILFCQHASAAGDAVE
jgi:hypothetical protein